MKLELVTGLNGSRIITESGIKSPIGDRHFAVGEAVWVDGDVVFGSERTSQPTVIYADVTALDTAITLYSYVGDNNYIHFVVYAVESGGILADIATTISPEYDAVTGAYAQYAFVYNGTLTNFAVIMKTLNDNGNLSKLTIYESSENGFTKKEISYTDTSVTANFYKAYYNSADSLIMLVEINSGDYTYGSGTATLKYLTYTDGNITDTINKSSIITSLVSTLFSSIQDSVAMVIADNDTVKYGNVNPNTLDPETVEWKPSNGTDKTSSISEKQRYFPSNLTIEKDISNSAGCSSILINDNLGFVLAGSSCTERPKNYLQMSNINTSNIGLFRWLVDGNESLFTHLFSDKSYANLYYEEKVDDIASHDIRKSWMSYHENSYGENSITKDILTDGTEILNMQSGTSNSGYALREIMNCYYLPIAYDYYMTDKFLRRLCTYDGIFANSETRNNYNNIIKLAGGMTAEGSLGVQGQTENALYKSKDLSIVFNSNGWFYYGQFFVDGTEYEKRALLLHDYILEIYNSENEQRNELDSSHYIYNANVSVLKCDSDKLNEVIALLQNNTSLPSS